MQVALVLCLVFAAASAGYIGAPTTLVRTPSFDSAVIKSDRLGGNFAYSTSEGHAYSAISPVVQNVVAPVGVSYSAQHTVTPAVAYSAPALAYSAPAVAYSGAYAAPALAYSGAYSAPALAYSGAYSAPALAYSGAYAPAAYGYNYGAYPYASKIVV